MTLRFSDYRFWLVCTALALGLLAACSSDTTPSGGDGSTGGAADSMTQS
jgi:hypothetical protein